VSAPTGSGDFSRSRDWPAGLRERLERLDEYRQGHILNDVPVFFLGSPEHKLWDQPRRDLGFAASALRLVGEQDGVLRRAVLLSQACDVMKESHPWVSVAPVYDATNLLTKSRIASARSGSTLHLVHLTALSAVGGVWVADLRLEMSIEKTLLLSREPHEAFVDEVDYARLTERLAVQRARAAVAGLCLEHIVEPLFARLRELGDNGRHLRDGVRELRVHCNDPVSPTIVTLYVIQKDDGDGRSVAVDADGWSSLVAELYENARQHGITLVGPEIETLWDLSARDYLMSAPIEDRISRS
jgi:hypothetical protein